MDTRRRIAVVAATFSVALGAGHIMQNGIPFLAGDPVAEVAQPTGITPVAAGLGPQLTPAPLPAEAAAALPDEPGAATDTLAAAAAQAEAAPAGDAPTITVAALTPDAGATPAGPALPQAQVLAALDPAAAAPETASPLPLPEPQAADAASCPVTLNVLAAPGATLEVALLAPCRAEERIVLRHAGLAVTGKTSAAGSLALTLPGMDSAGTVAVIFADGARVETAAALPDLAGYRRFGVQWQGADSFSLNAYEDGAEYGAPGHVWAQNLFQSAPGATMGGFLMTLGEAEVDLPMLAEVYTYPADAALAVDVTLEASVTAATCDREMLGEMLLSEGGAVIATDLTMAMPACDAVGDVLVLNNPVTDLKVAASE